MGAIDLSQEVKQSYQGIKPKSAPLDGYWVLPVTAEHAARWPPSPEATEDHPLDNWGPEYWAFRTPANRISKATLEKLQTFLELALEGDGFTHDPLKAHCKQSVRSKFDMLHIGIMCQYGQDHIGEHGVQLSRDTRLQTTVGQNDAMKRLFLCIYHEVAPLVWDLLRSLDPRVFQFDLW
jgi:hypothetical protein